MVLQKTARYTMDGAGEQQRRFQKNGSKKDTCIERHTVVISGIPLRKKGLKNLILTGNT